jgi:hypothetical protein
MVEAGRHAGNKLTIVKVLRFGSSSLLPYHLDY